MRSTANQMSSRRRPLRAPSNDVSSDVSSWCDDLLGDTSPHRLSEQDARQPVGIFPYDLRPRLGHRQVEIGLGRLLLVVQRGTPYCGEDGLGVCTVASRIRVVGAFSLGIDKGLFTANAVTREFFRHANVDDVDIRGLVGSGDCLLDGGVEECDRVIDLSLEVRGGIPWDNLEQ